VLVPVSSANKLFSHAKPSGPRGGANRVVTTLQGVKEKKNAGHSKKKGGCEMQTLYNCSRKVCGQLAKAPEQIAPSGNWNKDKPGRKREKGNTFWGKPFVRWETNNAGT